MEFELGKWLLDIAKYLVTALLLASIFSDMSNPWIVTMVIVSAVATLSLGLYLIKKNEKSINNKKQRKC